jgi:predicted DNA-binding transcriptional regulator AlpA
MTIRKEKGYSTGDEFKGPTPTEWIQDGRIRNVFKASAKLCLLLSLEEFRPPTSAGEKVQRAVRSTQQVEARDRKRGPKKDYDTAIRVSEIVERTVGLVEWRPRSDDICIELDLGEVRRPKTWAEKGHRNWFDCHTSEPRLVERQSHTTSSSRQSTGNLSPNFRNFLRLSVAHGSTIPWAFAGESFPNNFRALCLGPMSTTPSDNTINQLLTEPEVAAFLKVSVATMRRRRLLRQPPDFVKIGASVRYRREAIERLIVNAEQHTEIR